MLSCTPYNPVIIVGVWGFAAIQAGGI